MQTVPLRFLLALVSALVPGVAACAAEAVLSPPGTEVEMRAYGLGLLPIDGKFARFRGAFRYDPDMPGACHVMLEIEAESLAMPDGAVRETVLGPEFLDAARFPAITFDGGCGENAITGMLRLHGQTHPFRLELQRSDDGLTAIGRLKRAEWGITAQPFRVGSTIRIRVHMPAMAAPAGKAA